MSLEEKVKDLASSMKETEEFKNLSLAQTRIKLDPAAQDLLGELQSAQQEIQSSQLEGKQITADQIQHYQSLENQVKTNLTLSNLLKAQQAFGEVMNSVNETLSQELFGEEQSQ